MTEIAPGEVGSDENTARRILVLAADIAPCLHNLVDEARKNAIAILVTVYAETKARGARNVRSQGVASARVDYDVAGSFRDEDKTALRALCGATMTTSGHPVGHFPKGRPISRLWPEEY